MDAQKLEHIKHLLKSIEVDLYSLAHKNKQAELIEIYESVLQLKEYINEF